MKANLPTVPESVKPVKVIPYFDRVALWNFQPLRPSEIQRLDRECRGGVFVEDRLARFDSRRRQRLQLYQPTEAALCRVAKMRGALVNQIEAALDFIYRKPALAWDARDWLTRHKWRRWHKAGKTLATTHGDHAAHYDAERNARNKLAGYFDAKSRINTEANVAHVEWRALSLVAVRAAGIHSAGDLVRFDHRQFWQHRFLLRDVDRERLGRLWANRGRGTKRRAGSRATPDEERAAHVIINSVASIQELIDQHRSMRIERAMVNLPNEAFLPPALPSLISSYQAIPPIRASLAKPRPSLTPQPNGDTNDATVPSFP